MCAKTRFVQTSSILSALLALLAACAVEEDRLVDDLEGVSSSEQGLSGSVPVGSQLMTTDALNFRTGPGVAYAKQGVLPAGALLELVQGEPRNRFYHVRYQDKEGWAYGPYLKVVNSAPPGATPIPSTTTSTPVTPGLWSVDLASHPIGFTPRESAPMAGFIDSTWDRYNGGQVSVSYAADGVTRAFRAYIAPGSGTQRAEQVPVYRPGGEGTTFWIGIDFSLPVFTASDKAWGPCIFQLKRDGTGNGTALINIHGGRVVLEGASGIVGQGSSIDLGPVPSPGVKTRVVLGFSLHRSLGWAEAWRDGIQKGRVAPWVSKDTSTDGPGSFGSTLPTETNLGVYLKLGLYRGGGATPVEILFSDMRAATTQAGVR